MLRTIRSFKDSIFSWGDSIRWKKKKQRALRFLQGTYAWTTCAFCSTCCMHYKGALILILAKINIMCWTMRALEASNLQRHNKASHTQIYAQPTRYNLKHILNPKNNWILHIDRYTIRYKTKWQFENLYIRYCIWAYENYLILFKPFSTYRHTVIKRGFFPDSFIGARFVYWKVKESDGVEICIEWEVGIVLCSIMLQ